MSRKLALFAFIIAVVGAGMLIGGLTRPGEWYQQLAKPDFNPPSWVFGPVWTVLYFLIAIVGWRVWGRPGNSTLHTLWGLQMALNFLWSPVFFSLQSIGGALIVIMALLASIIAFVGSAWKRDRPSAVMFLPYLAWVAFATLLNLRIYQLN